MVRGFRADEECRNFHEKTDIKVIFCTPTTTPPAWLTEKYPEVLAVDIQGRIDEEKEQTLEGVVLSLL
jgi:beta-galactosidase GanA